MVNKQDKIIIARMFVLLSQILIANNIKDTTQSTWTEINKLMSSLNNDIDKWIEE